MSPVLFVSLAMVLGFAGCGTGNGRAGKALLEDPPVITSATYQHTLYNGKPQPIEAKTARENAPLVVAYFASLDALER
ncbi:MAG: hypothetical protein LBK63_12585, partial [Treponema sp.]|nr:hypothetical protein [Treponema sp.]